MFNGSTLFMTCLATVLTGAGREDKSAPATAERRGTVLEVFDGNRILVAIGKDDGAQKGQFFDVYRLKPQPKDFVLNPYKNFVTLAKTPKHDQPLSIGFVKLVEVGTRHSVGQFRAFSTIRVGGSIYLPMQVQKNDEAWRQPSPPSLEFYERTIGTYERGGAIIDLTLPKNVK
jgi:hypothetical protein